MKMYLKEKIGNPELFTGRKNELAYLTRWSDQFKREISMSTAILSRRKTGKTALMQRLYNMVFEKNHRVVPFYFEIKEEKQWYGDPDSRSYRISFKKIKDTLGYNTKYTVSDGTKEIYNALNDGKTTDSIKTKTVEWYKHLLESKDLIDSITIKNQVF